VINNFRPIRGRAGTPRHPVTSSGSATGRVPIGKTANNAVHQMTTYKAIAVTIGIRVRA